MGQRDAVRSDGLTLRTLETVNVGLKHSGDYYNITNRQMISRFLLGEDHCKQTGYYFARTDDYCVAHLDHGCLALPGEGGCLLLPDAGALGLVEDEGGRAVVDVWVAVHTVVVSAMVTREVSPGLCCDHPLTCCTLQGPRG